MIAQILPSEWEMGGQKSRHPFALALAKRIMQWNLRLPPRPTARLLCADFQVVVGAFVGERFGIPYSAVLVHSPSTAAWTRQRFMTFAVQPVHPKVSTSPAESLPHQRNRVTHFQTPLRCCSGTVQIHLAKLGPA